MVPLAGFIRGGSKPAMKNKITSSFIVIIAVLCLYKPVDPAAPRIFSAAEKGLLRNGNIMTFVYMKGKGNASSGIDDIGDFCNISALPSGWDGYDVVIVEKAYLRAGVGAAANLRIFNTLTARSRLKGMKYYSISEGTAAKLILESYSVKSCADRSRIADEAPETIPAMRESAFIIKDNRLGVICFNGRVEYRGGMFMENDISCGRVTRLGMDVFNDGGYVIKRYIIPDDSGSGYFYCSVQIMAVESSIMKRLDLLGPENFGNRIRGETVHLLGLAGYDISAKITAFR